MSLLKLFALILSLMFVIACASEEEKKERRENSYDISGQYKSTVAAGSQVDMQFEIKNESGRHDIVISAIRVGEMTPQEIQLLTKHNINVEVVKNHFKNPIILGQGFADIQLDGGENISTDFGKSSEFYVCTQRLKYNQEYEVSYCMQGRITKADKKMIGKLVLKLTRAQTVVEKGVPKKQYTVLNVDMAFQSTAHQVFYRQYLGSWSGDSFSLLNGVTTSQLEKLDIQQRGSDAYQVKLKANISFEYESFELQSESVDSLTNLMAEYPSVVTSYVAPSGRRLVLFAQIWSLGNLTGTWVLLDGDAVSDVATVRLKKD